MTYFLVTVGDPATELSARGWANESGGFVLDSFTLPDSDNAIDGVTDLAYIPRVTIGPGEFVVVRAYGETDPQTAEQYGAVARAEIDVEAGTVTLTKLLSVGAEPIMGSIVAPDGSQAVLVPDGESPYLADLTNGGEPQPIDLPVGLGQTVGWL